MSKIQRAIALRATIEGLAENLTDEAALDSVELFPEWSGDGVAYAVGKRVRYIGDLYKVIQAHTSQPNWTPAEAPSLFALVLTSPDGTPQEWVQPDSTNPYMIGDRVLFNGQVYESVIDNNIWSPTDYPAGWKLVE